ncbi:hypothetical protein [Palpita vitrealis nucleopolyhedrovirus]|uniref:Uncharacterized protein n=1 Tax=Palpita vitrealis nucleopolyhedrovirus TaxID=2951960 RepID=A0AAE9RYR2_9ABAC|nr:hypothetical protein [Palpita vitrealis nucleopolyhedrovirus]
MTKKLLIYCNIQRFVKTIAHFFCRCVVSHIKKDKDNDEGDRYYQYNNKCNIVTINIGK